MLRHSIWVTFLLVCCQNVIAANLPPGFTESTVAAGLVSPVVMESAPDGRIFVCEQNGRLRIVKNGQLLGTPFVTVQTEFHLDRGLLGVAFDPNFAQNNFVYVLYTSPNAPAHNIVSRFTANGDIAVPGSEVQLFHLTNMPNTHHCDASIMFGPDGRLYIGVADNANGNNAQSLNNMFGKILRINADGSIPGDNPFYNQASGNNRAIWALGLRNPFTFTFQRTTGRMIVNDVGWEHYDEINEGVRGANYGWPVVEGNGNNAAYRNPLFIIPQYNAPVTGAAITGGVFYNPPVNQFPAEYVGDYFFIDYISGWLRRLDMDTLTASMFATGLPVNNVNLRVGIDGSLYYLQRGPGANTGKLMRIQYTLGDPPTITQHPQSQSAYPGQQITFSVSAAGNSPFSYQWQRDGIDIAGATNDTYTLLSVQLSDDGAQFRCVVSNQFGQATSNDAVLTVQPNDPPEASIETPTAGTLYSAGQAVAFSGSGMDAQDGALPPSAFTWQIDQIRPNHSRPFIPPFSGVNSGTFLPPDEGQPDADVGYRIFLTVTDSHGATHTVSREIWGRVVSVTLATEPPGLNVALGGVPYTAPHTFQGVTGFRRIISAPLTQTLNGTTYDFVAWSDGGAAEHEISTPVQDSTIRATNAVRQPPTVSEISVAPAATVIAGTQLTFSATASGRGTLTWHWNFGDGQTSALRDATTHAYANEGQYTVTLTVTDRDGLQTARGVTVNIQPRPLPVITQHPANQTVYAGQPASFSVVATSDTPLTYRWQRNGTNISGATAATYTIPATPLSDNGAQFRCVVTNQHGSVTSNAATLTVTQNMPPVASIDTPAAGTLYVAGQVVSFSGSGTDAEDGVLAPAAFTWKVDQLSGGQVLPFVAPFSGVAGGSFTPADQGNAAADVTYRITLTVRDANGGTHSVTRDVQPQVVNVTLATDPGGLPLQLDGVEQSTPLTFSGVVGFKRTLAAPLTATLNGTSYDFAGWSNGGAATHEIAMPAQDSTLVALYVPRQPPVLSGFTVRPGTTVPAGTEVMFSCTAVGAVPLRWRWQYGEGVIVGTNPDATEHIYYTPGSYRVMLTITDRYGAETGHIVWITVTAANTGDPNVPGGSNPTDPANPNQPQDPHNLPPLVNDPQAAPLLIAKVGGQLNFAKTNSDSVTVTCVIPIEHAPAEISGELALNMGGASFSFALTKGKGKNGNGRVAVTPFGYTQGRSVTIKVNLTKGNFGALWLPDHAQIAARTHHMPIAVRIGGRTFGAQMPVEYVPSKNGRYKLRQSAQ